MPVPPLSLNASSSAAANGGNLDAKTNALVEGDWSTTYAPDSSAGNPMNKKTMMYIGLAAVAYFFIKNKKVA